MLSVQNDGRIACTLAAFLLLCSPVSSYSQSEKSVPAPGSHADAALEKRELIKITVLRACEQKASQIIEALARQLNAEPVTAVYAVFCPHAIAVKVLDAAGCYIIFRETCHELGLDAVIGK